MRYFNLTGLSVLSFSYIRISTCVAFVLFSFNVKAQYYVSGHLTTDDGLSSGNVNCIIQDSKGYMWFGTEDGLNKFDGYNYTVYKHDPEINTSISDNWIESIVEDGNGLWIGTRNGLNRYSYQGDNFRQYFHDNKDSNTISSNTVYNILKDGKGQIWVGTTMGLNLYNQKQDNFHTYSIRPENNPKTGSNQVRGITLDANDFLLLSTMSGLYKFDPQTKQFRTYLYDEIHGEPYGTPFIVCVYADKKGNLWIGTESEGVIYYNMANGIHYHFVHDPNDAKSISYDGISNIMEDNSGNIWISTSRGLSVVPYGTIVKSGRGIFNNFNKNDETRKSLSTEIINTVYQDRNNKLWIGGRFGHIDIIENQTNRFRNVKFTDIDNRFSSNNMSAMVEDDDGNIWLGSDGGGIYFWDRSNNHFKVYRHIHGDNQSLSTDKVIALTLDSYNNLWIGTWNGGLDKLDLKKNTFTHYRYNLNDPNSLATDNIFYLMEDSRKNLWIGLWFGGVNIYDRKNDIFKRFPFGIGDSSVMSGYIAMHIQEDSKENIWIASESNGLNLLNPANNTFKKYLHQKEDTTSISNDAVTCIFEDSQNRLWIGTRGGLNLLNRENSSFQRFTVADGLPNDVICRILEDDKGDIWLSTFKGIARLTISGQGNNVNISFKNYDQKDGLQSNQFNLWSGLRTSKGELIFGGVNGISIFYPDKMHDNTNIPPIVLTGFSIFNKPVPIGKPGSPLTKHISETKEIRIRYDQSVISFEYAALNFINSEKNEYAFILEGFEKDWNYVGNLRKATYTNLDPGKYIFRVKGSNNDGYWNNEGISVLLTITPPWWGTLFFRILFVLILIFLSIAFYFNRIRNLRQQKVLLESIVKERTREVEGKNEKLLQQSRELNEANAMMEERQQHIEEQEEQLQAINEHLVEVNEMLMEKQETIINQASFLEETNKKLEKANQQLIIINSTKDKLFSIIAHDLKNPFNSILGFSDILLEKFHELTDDKKLKFINIINDSSQRLFLLLENLLQWARTQAGNVHHSPEVFDLCEVVRVNHDLLKHLMDEKMILFNFSTQENISVIADRNMVTTVVRNLLANAIKYTEKGTIAVNIKSNGLSAEVNIIDSGTGIPESKLNHIFEVDQQKSTSGTRGEKGSGLGLLICREFIQINGGEISVKSTQGFGTTFTFTLPLYLQ